MSGSGLFPNIVCAYHVAFCPLFCLFRRYDVELVQRIESLVGLKLELYPTEQEAVLLLLERVGEAQRIATMQMKEADSKKKGGKRKGTVDDQDDADQLTGRAFKKKY